MGLIDEAVSAALSAGESALASATTGAKSQSAYDAYRTKVWTAFANLADSVTIARQQGLVDRTGLQQYIDAVTKLMADFQNTTNTVYVPSIGSSWVMPRFHDYYDFMNNLVNSWRNEILTLPMPSIIGSLFGGSTMPAPSTTGVSPTGTPVLTTSSNIMASLTSNPWLLIALAGGLVMYLGHKQR